MANFVWASKKPIDDIATIYESNITLNKSASSYFETAYVVLLGLDRESLQIAVRPASKEDVSLGFIPEEQQHNITVKPSYSRICNKQFVQEVAMLIGLQFDEKQGHKFRATWNHKENALIIDLSHREG
ncbi:MAG TPA: hypothetical protein DCR44_05475 [Acholeplasmatales bacterium]|nr:hypothetical protein [Acholeplasmatales bacterium]